MRRCLAVLPLILSQGCVAVSPATSRSGSPDSVIATDTCFGQAATIVVEYGDFETTGTSGPDVVISYGGDYINTGAGDDLVCVLGEPRSDTDHWSREIDTGNGDDRVDTRGTHFGTSAILGDGADQYEGGPGQDDVTAGSWNRGRYHDTERDSIRTGDLPDRVTSGGGSDTVLLEGRRDTLILMGTPDPGAVLNGGSGSNLLDMTLTGSAWRSWTIDNRDQRLYADKTELAQWDGFTRFAVYAEAAVDFVGSGLDEALTVKVHKPQASDGPWKLPKRPVDARMRGGHDAILFLGGPNSSQFNGGSGTDKLRYIAFARRGHLVSSDVSLDLAAGWLTDREAQWQRRWRVRQFEDAAVANGDEWNGDSRTTIHGTNGPNSLSVPRNGGDATVYGASGNDVLLGGSGDDTLLGGRGRDSANGREGTDQCEAEVVDLCERLR